MWYFKYWVFQNNILHALQLCPTSSIFAIMWPLLINLQLKPFFGLPSAICRHLFFFFFVFIYLNLVCIYNSKFFNMTCLCLCDGFSVNYFSCSREPYQSCLSNFSILYSLRSLYSLELLVSFSSPWYTLWICLDAVQLFWNRGALFLLWRFSKLVCLTNMDCWAFLIPKTIFTM